MLGGGLWNDSASFGADQEQSRNWSPEASASTLIEGEKEPKGSASTSASTFVWVIWDGRPSLVQMACWSIVRRRKGRMDVVAVVVVELML